VAESFHLSRRPGRALGGVDAACLAEVQREGRALGQPRELLHTGDHPHRDADRVGQVDHCSASWTAALAHVDTVRPREALEVSS
jgi:hypothetical protein